MRSPPAAAAAATSLSSSELSARPRTRATVKRKDPHNGCFAYQANKKQQQQDFPSSSGSAPAVSNIFGLLDEDCRIKIFSFLTWQDLAGAAPTSRPVRDDCRHPALTQNADRQMVLTVRWRCSALCHLLAAMADYGRFDTYTKLKIVRRGKLSGTPDSVAQLIRGGRTMPQITSLEVDSDPTSDGTLYVGLGDVMISESSLWRAVAEHLPNLRRITVSSGFVPGLCLREMSGSCPNLTSLTWRGQARSLYLSGVALGRGGARDLYMDDCTFYEFRDPFAAATDDDDDDDTDDDDESFTCMFASCAGTLERVSIRNARYYVHDFRGRRKNEAQPPVFRNAAKDLSQRAIVDLVRRAPNLRWLRSDLTPENGATLQRERPDVAFVS
jgi:hypothetical protein